MYATFVFSLKEIGELAGLRELHLQGNRLTVLPPSLGSLDFLSSRAILKLDNNPWVPPIEDQLMLGVSHVIEYIRTGTRYFKLLLYYTGNIYMELRSQSDFFFGVSRDLVVAFLKAAPAAF